MLSGQHLKSITCFGVYQPILNNSVWLSSEVEIEGYINSLYTIAGDTAINGTLYKIFYKEYVNLPGINNNPWISGYDSLYFREDNSLKKFFQYYQGMGEQLVFDFSMQPGDSLYNLNYHGFTLTTIDSILTNQGFRKRFVFTHASYPPIIWVEGIGNLTMPFIKDAFYDTTYAQILCVHSQGNLVYEYQNYVPVTCSFYNSVNQIPPKSNDLEIYPSPAQNMKEITFNYSTLKNSTGKLEIYNLNGNVVQAYMLPTGSSEKQILLPDLSPGFYMARLTSEDKVADVKFTVVE